MKTRVSITILCAALAGFGSCLFAAQTATDPTPTAATDNAQPAKLSPGLDDIVKLTKAGVSDSVILTFVQSSGVMYRPTAQDLIELGGAGVSAQVTTALMQRGGELHQSALQSQQQAQAAAQSHRVQPAQPPTTYAASPTYTTAPASSGSTVVYIGSPGYTYAPGRAYGGYYYPRDYYYPRYSRYFNPGISFGIRVGGHHGGHRHCR